MERIASIAEQIAHFVELDGRQIAHGAAKILARSNDTKADGLVFDRLAGRTSSARCAWQSCAGQLRRILGQITTLVAFSLKGRLLVSESRLLA